MLGIRDSPHGFSVSALRLSRMPYKSESRSLPTRTIDWKKNCIGGSAYNRIPFVTRRNLLLTLALSLMRGWHLMRPNVRNKTLSPRGREESKDQEQQMLLQGFLQDGSVDPTSSSSLKLDEDLTNPYEDLDNLDVLAFAPSYSQFRDADLVCASSAINNRFQRKGKRELRDYQVHLQARQSWTLLRVTCHVRVHRTMRCIAAARHRIAIVVAAAF